MKNHAIQNYMMGFIIRFIFSVIAWFAFFYTAWQLYLEQDVDVVKAAWAAIFIQTYYHSACIYLVLDYGIITKLIKPKWPRSYWFISLGMAFIVFFSIGFGVKSSPYWSNFMLWEGECVGEILHPHPAKALESCDRFKQTLSNLTDYIKNILE